MKSERLLPLLALSLLAVTAAPAQFPADAARATAFRRAETLTHGINASGWFGGWGDYKPERTSSWVTADDFKLMRSLGIRYVRIGVDPVYFGYGRPDDPSKDALWQRLDDAVNLALTSGLEVDLCVFPRDDYKQQLATDHGATQFLFLWQALARHFAHTDPDRVFFELMNESEVQDPYRWIGIEGAADTAIRHFDTTHTIIASGAHYDSLDDLLVTEPLSDPNVIYTFHFYEPYQFTHQGATWGSPEWLYYKDIPFPATVADLQPQLDSIPNDIARYQLFLYGVSNWNADTIRQRIAFAAQWGRERKVPIICNEFGAYRDTAPPDSRARYIEAVRSGLEANHIGWGMWDWNGNFGLATRTNGHLTIDPAIAHALGLQTHQ
ncbi:MAG TPA: cellulase family glycosylhydrolase [Candidatus Aquilonibacter sp.]|nr:cellulase family glycosylhydrolase [Candidatus Aquilonibacter sp.]